MVRVSDELYDTLKRYSKTIISKAHPGLSDAEAVRKAISEGDSFARLLYEKYRLATQIEGIQRKYYFSPSFVNKIAGEAVSIQKQYEREESQAVEAEIQTLIERAANAAPGSIEKSEISRLAKAMAELEVFEARFNPAGRRAAAGAGPLTKRYETAAEQIDRLAADLVWKSSAPMDMAQARVEIRKQRPDLRAAERRDYVGEILPMYKQDIPHDETAEEARDRGNRAGEVRERSYMSTTVELDEEGDDDKAKVEAALAATRATLERSCEKIEGCALDVINRLAQALVGKSAKNLAEARVQIRKQYPALHQEERRDELIKQGKYVPIFKSGGR